MLPKIVLVGAGRFGNNHLKTLIKLDENNVLKLIGVVEQDSKIIKKIKNDYNLPVSKNLDDFMDNVDGFDVVTPPKTHHKIVKNILKKNKHVFVEKPLTLKSKEAYELYLLSKKHKKNLQVGHIFRYFSIISKLKKLIDWKKDPPFLIIGKFLQNRIQSHDTGSIFIFMHGFDILDYLIGKNPKKIFSISNQKFPKSNLESNSITSLQYPHLNARLNLGWIPHGVSRNIEIFTSKKRILCNLLTNEIEIFEKNRNKKKIKVQQKSQPLYLELYDFASSIKNKNSVQVDGKVGARIVKICELATCSTKKNKIFKFD